MNLKLYAKNPGLAVAAFLLSAEICCCGARPGNKVVDDGFSGRKAQLEERLEEIVKDLPGQVGVAVIVDGRDTVAVNNSADYPLMSLFKLHQALACCHILEENGTGLDSVMTIDRKTLDMETWSPMIGDYKEERLRLTVRELLRYILVSSDNNASNILFDSIISPEETDRYIRSAIPSGEFRIIHRESDMKRDMGKSYENRSSPLAYAVLVDKIFNDSLVSPGNQAFIREAMADCQTGLERINAGLPKDEGIGFAHKTGSGYVNSRGEIVAVNDGGYVSLPSGKGYSIAVLIKDFGGSQQEAEKVISRISEAVYESVR